MLQRPYCKIFIFVIINLILSSVIEYRYLLALGSLKNINFQLFSLFTIVSVGNLCLIYLLIIIITTALSILISKKITPLYYFIVALGMFAFQFFLLLDSSIYRLFKFHFNNQILDIFTSGAFNDVVQITTCTKIFIGLALSGLLTFEVLLFYVANAILLKIKTIKIKSILIILFSIALVKQTLYSVSKIQMSVRFNKKVEQGLVTWPNEVVALSRAVPLNFKINLKIPIRDVMILLFDFKKTDFNMPYHFDTQTDQIILKTLTRFLNYPHFTPKQIKKLSKYPNIIIIAVDSLRADMMSGQIMPNVYKFSQKAQNYTNHYSNANSTACGITALFYSLKCDYLDKAAKSKTGPVFIDALNSLGYKNIVYASASLKWPNFRDSVFTKVNEKNIFDEHSEKESYKKDEQITNVFLNYLDTQTVKPFFAFVFYDSVHAHESGEKHRKFKPYKNIDWATVKNDPNVNPLLFNSYKNSAHYVDHLIGKIINKLESNNLLQNSIVIITADHGEEVFDYENIGHGSAFNKAQVKVPFVFYKPSIKPQNIDVVNMHYNVVPTILEELGYDKNHYGYASGKSFLDKNYIPPKVIPISGFDHSNAIINGNYIFILDKYNMYSVRDIETYKPVTLKHYNVEIFNQKDLYRFWK